MQLVLDEDVHEVEGFADGLLGEVGGDALAEAQEDALIDRYLGLHVRLEDPDAADDSAVAISGHEDEVLSGILDTELVGDYLKLPFMVLGAVMAGWSVMMIQIVRGPLSDGSTWALRVLIRSLVLWFVLDTGMSLVLGFPGHALFNVPFAIALGIPLVKLRSMGAPRDTPMR